MQIPKSRRRNLPWNGLLLRLRSAENRRSQITDTSAGGDAASFYQCADLKVAEGTFPGFIEFGGSGVEKIGNLVITRPNTRGEAASFACCFSLKVAEGTYPGTVDFRYAALERSEDFHIILPSGEEIVTEYTGCKKIEALTLW